MRATPSHSRTAALVLGTALVLPLLVHCAAAPPPPDFLYGPGYAPSEPPVEPPPPAPAPPTVTSAQLVVGRRVLARSLTHALASDGVNVYFGDETQNALMTVPGAGGFSPELVERPAPLDIALDSRAISWIGRSGDVVRRVSHRGAPATTIGPRGAFSSIAASRGEVFVTDDVGNKSVLRRIAGPTVTKIATFDAPARAVGVDDTNAYVITGGDVLRVPRGGGEIQKLASGADLRQLELDRDNVYVTAKLGASRGVLRVPKAGGSAVELSRGVRDAPIAVWGDDLYFFVDAQAELRKMSTSGGPSTLAVREDALDRVTALAVDQLRIIIGTEGEGVLAVPRAR